MAKIKFHNIGPVHCKKITAKAVLVRKGDDEWWFPQSTLSVETLSSLKAETEIASFRVEEWFLEKEEIPYE